MSSGADVVTQTERIAPEPSQALAALLGTDAPATTLPSLWHGLYLLERRPHADLGPDGHPTSGIPAPPGPGRKRMFAGGRVRTLVPLVLGERATRTTRVTSTAAKQGRSGPLTFVTVRSEYSQCGALAIVDESDIVYRSAASSVSSQPGSLGDRPFPAPDEPSLSVRVDEAFLFRFSALTYNAHRIHYDHHWVRMEGYPDLVVHGPLQALMMAELVRRTGEDLVGREFRYRLTAPMIGPQTFTVCAAPDGIGSGAAVRDVHGNVTAVSSLDSVSP